MRIYLTRVSRSAVGLIPSSRAPIRPDHFYQLGQPRPDLSQVRIGHHLASQPYSDQARYGLDMLPVLFLAQVQICTSLLPMDFAGFEGGAVTMTA